MKKKLEAEKERNSIYQKYGTYDMKKCDALASSLIMLEQSCQNISLQFQSISCSVNDTRSAFQNKNFTTILQIIPKQHHTKYLQDITQWFCDIPLIGYKLLQEPITALIANDIRQLYNKPLQQNNDGPHIEEVKENERNLLEMEE